jgi:hypothetical protein
VFGDLKRFSLSSAAKVYTQILPQLSYPDPLALLCHKALGSTIDSKRVQNSIRVYGSIAAIVGFTITNP